MKTIETCFGTPIVESGGIGGLGGSKPGGGGGAGGDADAAAKKAAEAAKAAAAMKAKQSQVPTDRCRLFACVFTLLEMYDTPSTNQMSALP
jgi:hypothetical protein